MNQDPRKEKTAASLFEQLRLGSQQALAGIIQLYRQRLMAYIQMYVTDHQIANEIFNETMFILWQNRQKAAAMHHPYNWMVVVTHRKILNKLRDEKTYQAMLRNRMRLLLFVTSIDATAEYKDLIMIIDKAKELLPPKEKQVFDLFLQNGWSSREISRHFHTSENTIRTQLNSAIRKIRKQLSRIIHGIFI